MIAEEYLARSGAFRRLKNGCHGQLIKCYAARLVDDGLAQGVTVRSLSLIGDFMKWMAHGRFRVADIDEPMVERFLRNRVRKRPDQVCPGRSERCPSLNSKRVSPHVLRHTAAMELLQAGVDSSVIALWLGHECIETTQVGQAQATQAQRADPLQAERPPARFPRGIVKGTMPT